MRKNSKKLVLPAIAAAGAVMGAAHMASADFVVTMSAATTSGAFNIYTLSVVNNNTNFSGTLISGADVTITMTTPGQYLKVDNTQDLGSGSGYSFDGVKDVNLTGNQYAGTYNNFGPPPTSATIATRTVTQDSFGSVAGTFVSTGGAALTSDTENGQHDPASGAGSKLWSTDANGGTLSTVFSSLSTLEIAVANTGGGVGDTKATKFVNIVVPIGDKFTVTGSVGGPSSGGTSSSFQTNFSTGNGTVGGSGPIVLLSSSQPGNTGTQLGGTYSPATSPTLTVTHTGPSDYLPGLITGLATQSGFTPIAGFQGTDVEKFLLKLSSSADDATLVADINASGNSTVTASLASADPKLASFDGISGWDIELTSTGTGPENGFFGFNFSGDSSIGAITVADVAAVPEPATAGLLLVGGLCLMARRRRSGQQA
jgi:hypothetical protein